ncbi:MAG: ribonuclease J [Patescibacteria group bacterium]|nr:ribonuclease J [Patescibacteria group bacterium]
MKNTKTTKLRPRRKQHRRKPARFSNREKLKIMVVGGLEEVGRNCTLLEYGDDIIIIDIGLQFPEEDMPGIDYIIPNLSYLKGKEKNIRGIIITHAHLDHIGGIPHLSPKLGNPPIFTTRFSSAVIKKRQEDFENKRLNIKEITKDDQLVLGKFRVEFYHINHNIPESLGIVVHTPQGTVVHTGDWKFDYTPVGGEPADFSKLAKIGDKGVLALLSDSTNSDKKGHQISESEIGVVFEKIIKASSGRIIVGTFASLLSRMRQVIEIADKLGKKVAVDGFSMKSNLEISRKMGYVKVKPGTLIDMKQVDDFPPEKVIILCTGAQGEGKAVLMRITNNEHRNVQIQPGDTIVFSSSIIPGNERTIQRLKDTLVKKGAKIIHTDMMDVHAGGHAKADDVKLMLLLLKPKYFVPIEGNRFLLEENAAVAESMGIPEKNIFVADNGQVMEFAHNRGWLTNNHIKSDYVFVDGLGVGDVSQIVLRDRQMLAADGMVVVITLIDGKTGKLVGSPDIISRGFVYLKENKGLIEDTRKLVRKVAQDKDKKSAPDNMYLKNKLRDEVGAFLFKRTERRPMILPVVIEV